MASLEELIAQNRAQNAAAQRASLANVSGFTVNQDFDPNKVNPGSFNGQVQIPAPNVSQPGNLAGNQLSNLQGGYGSISGLRPATTSTPLQQFSNRHPPTTSTPLQNPNAAGNGSLFTAENFGIAANVAQGVSGLANAYTNFKQLGVAEDQLALQEEFARTNLANQTALTNNRLNDQNAYKAAQGRTDFADLVGGATSPNYNPISRLSVDDSGQIHGAPEGAVTGRIGNSLGYVTPRNLGQPNK